MKIATNTPLSFPLKDGYEFFPLGDAVSDADMIVLMLQKNWGGKNVDQIKAMTRWISMYPKDVPCYIIGCETTIPGKELERYLHREREDAVRGLCDEVLSRSNSIGVRGEITYRYLTEILEYNQDQVDLIYTSDSKESAERIRDFLRKNGCKLQSYVSSMAAFQAAPRKFAYERNPDFQKEIIINPPYVTKSDTLSLIHI